MIHFFRNVLLMFFIAVPFAVANDLLPDPENVAIEGNTLVWDAVPNATGYNIYLGYSYFDTVKGQTQYTLQQSGSYWVVAFDDAGNYGSQYGGDRQVDYESSSNATSVIARYYASVVQTTCVDVGPGESCIASCDSTATQLDPPRFTRYVSGGACSTSDIVEADAFISDRTYKCTVPTFSGEVVAQAVCVHR